MRGLEDKLSNELDASYKKQIILAITGLVAATYLFTTIVSGTPSENGIQNKRENINNYQTNSTPLQVIEGSYNLNSAALRKIKISKNQRIWDISSKYLESVIDGDFNKIPTNKKNRIVYTLTQIILEENNMNWDDARKIKVGQEISLPYMFYKDKELIIITGKELYKINIESD